ncbi:hypothetical protein [Pedobacter aquatilis]|uniref:NACHT domain-containing protein n=1 Tax=Pedobacter aquatilis TaxID=351343 RepID=UPI00292F4001|nr:hypothetical protein [Pedobacter aquatilis]
MLFEFTIAFAFQTGDSVIDDALSVIFIAFLGLALFTILTWIRSSAKLEDHVKQTIEEGSKYFVPNGIEIRDQNGQLIPIDRPEGKDELDALIHHILHSSKKYYILIAPTGIGKTTFLSNFYLRYYKKSRFRFLPPLLFGHIHKSSTKAEIKSMEPKRSDEYLDIFKLKIKGNKTAIMLLDGLDEYSNDDVLTETQFWEAFDKEWSARRGELAVFGKVIISVREQFFQQANLSSEGLKGVAIDGNPPHYIYLKPFTSSQIDSYIRKRFAHTQQLSKVLNTAKLLNRNSALKIEGLPLLSIPLILNYIDRLSEQDLLKEASSRNKSFIDRYDVYSVIVNKWLARERDEKHVKSDELTQSLSFMAEIAFKICCSSDGFSISSERFYQLEKIFFKQINKTLNSGFISHFSNRSLLKIERIGREQNVSFVHSTFLEYFFARFARQPESISVQTTFDAIEKRLSKPNMEFTLEMLINWGWYDLKSRPDLRPDAHRINPRAEFPVHVNNPSRAVMRKWQQYIERISPFRAVKILLLTDLCAELENVDKDYRGTFVALENLGVINENFLVNGVADQEMAIAFGFFKNFVSAIEIVDGDLDSGESLYYFTGARNITVLHVASCDLRGDCLQYFQYSTELNCLVVPNNKLTTESFRFFKHFKNISYFGFPYNQIDSRVMEYLKESARRMNRFVANGNLTETRSLDYLRYFRSDVKWVDFGIKSADAAVVYEQYLRSSASTLQDLRLADCGIDDENLVIVSVFPYIKNLILSGNQFTGRSLEKYLVFKDTLAVLNFDSCKNLRGEYLYFLKDFKKLKKVYLANCPGVSDECKYYLKSIGIIIPGQ